MNIYINRSISHGPGGFQGPVKDTQLAMCTDRKKQLAYLKLDLSLGNVLLAATAVGDLLGFGNLIANGLMI
jgi:hypothetical protein